MRARVKYSKNEDVKYVGHLDAMRTFIRCIKRTCIPIKYSKGFNPRVQISFALPLGVGVTSKSEYFDLEVESKMNETMFVAELNSTLPLGFRALGVTYIEDIDKRSLMSLVKEAIYEIEIQNDGDINKLKELFSKEEILIEKETKDKKVKTINLKNYILDIDIKPAKEDKKLITVHGKAGSVDNLNPMYIIEAIEKNIGVLKDYNIHRKELILAE
jgi:radical SAM-linked protein